MLETDVRVAPLRARELKHRVFGIRFHELGVAPLRARELKLYGDSDVTPESMSRPYGRVS